MVHNKTILGRLLRPVARIPGAHFYAAEDKIALAEKHELRQDRNESRGAKDALWN